QCGEALGRSLVAAQPAQYDLNPIPAPQQCGARSHPVTEQVPPIAKMAIILAPRCGRFPWNLNHQGFAFDRWIQCWVRKSGCVCPINPAMTGRKPSPTTMPPFFGWLRKAVFYQRTAGSSSAKESQEAPRESMCSTNIH